MSARSSYESNLVHWTDIQDHLPRLFNAALGNCLEIGVRTGVSTSAILSGLEEHGGHLWSIDINEDCKKVFAGHPQWDFICADTRDCVITKIPEHFTMCLIDGDHSYDGAISDLRKFGSKAAIVFVHDTDHPQYPGVRRAVEEFCKESGRRVTYHPGSCGMAEIHHD